MLVFWEGSPSRHFLNKSANSLCVIPYWGVHPAFPNSVVFRVLCSSTNTHSHQMFAKHCGYFWFTNRQANDKSFTELHDKTH